MCVCGESSTDRNTSTHSEDRVGEMGGLQQTDRETSKERQGELQTHSRQMEEPGSPKAAL